MFFFGFLVEGVATCVNCCVEFVLFFVVVVGDAHIARATTTVGTNATFGTQFTLFAFRHFGYVEVLLTDNTVVGVVFVVVFVVAVFVVAVATLAPVLLLVFAAFGTEGNAVLLAVVAALRPANLTFVVESGLASFAFVLTFVILGGLDKVKVRLGSHRNRCCCLSLS